MHCLLIDNTLDGFKPNVALRVHRSFEVQHKMDSKKRHNNLHMNRPNKNKLSARDHLTIISSDLL